MCSGNKIWINYIFYSKYGTIWSRYKSIICKIENKIGVYNPNQRPDQPEDPNRSEPIGLDFWQVRVQSEPNRYNPRWFGSGFGFGGWNTRTEPNRTDCLKFHKKPIFLLRL